MRSNFFVARTARVVAISGITLMCHSTLAYAQGNCPGATPNDDTNDDRAIEACLNSGIGEVRLDPGYYWVAQTIFMRTSGVTFTDTNSWPRASLLARDELFGPILEVEPGTNSWNLYNLQFGGRVYARIHRNQCVNGVHRKFGNNLFLTGDNFNVHNISSQGAMCGSAMEVDGSNFWITESIVSGNGLDEDEPGGSARWSDGITLLRCDGGHVIGNDTDDNTDIGIVVGGGDGCEIAYNTIDNFYKRAFGGLHIGSFGNGGRTHPNSWYHHNVTQAGYDKQAFGIVVGFHPWGNEPVDWAGEVVDNEAYGAVTNLAIDGIQGGIVQRNIWGGPQGTRGQGCNTGTADYTAGHFGSASIQGGYIPRIYDCWE